MRHESVDNVHDEAQEDRKQDGGADGEVEPEVFLFDPDVEGEVAWPGEPSRVPGFRCGHEDEPGHYCGNSANDKYFSGF